MKNLPLQKFLYSLLAFLCLSLFFACDSSKESNDNATQEVENTEENDAADAAEPPSSYDDIAEMLAVQTNYSEEQNSLKKLDNGSYQVFVTVTTEDTDYILSTLKNSLLTVVFRTFIHTEANEITVEAIPLKIIDATQAPVPLDKQMQKISVSRDKAQQVMKDFIALENFNGLVGESMGDMYLKDRANEKLQKLVTEDYGDPGMNKVFDALSK
ncbi:MAG: hypothetical protein JJT94_12850 [Bernardetiaceae bacterium]|nr:hypothetical protein [Bernardetiaceae bacterium]